MELAIFDQLTEYANHFLSVFVSVYRGLCGARRVLMGLLEEWREQFDHNKIVELPFWICLKHLPAFPILITKLNAYGFNKNTLTLLNWKTENNLSGLKPITAHF